MKSTLAVLTLLLFTGAAHAYTTMDCVSTHRHPTLDTSFHVPSTLKVSQGRIKKIDRLTGAITQFAYEGPDRSGGWRVYVSNYQKGTFLGLIDRNWDAPRIQLGEQLYVYEGVV